MKSHIFKIGLKQFISKGVNLASIFQTNATSAKLGTTHPKTFDYGEKMKAKKKKAKTKTKAPIKKKVKSKTKAATRTKAKVKKVVRKPKKVSPIPEGALTLTPYLIVKDAIRALDFYKKALGAKEKYRLESPKGVVGHAEMRIGDCNIMLAEEVPAMDMKGPKSVGGTPVSMHVYSKDVDKAAKIAVATGMTVVHPVENQFYGERAGKFIDPFGHVWFISSRIEKVTPKEMQKRADAMTSKK